MDYTELLKLYYIDKSLHQAEYERRLNAPDTVKLRFRVKGNQAFFVQNAEISGIVHQILRTDKSISLLSSKLPEVAHDQFRKRCLIDEIILTNKIEGVYSTRREIASILADLESAVKGRTARKRFQGLVNQYFMLKSKKHKPLTSCEDLRRLYDELVSAEVIEENPDNAPDGRLFRKDSVSVHTITEREIHRGSYPESAIYSELEAALEFLNNENIEFLYRVSVFHYLLGYIHPFYDGNGRLGRFIISDLLSQELSPLLSYRISGTIMENISSYYNAFKTCNDKHNLGDLTPFLAMLLNMIKTACLHLEESLHNGSTRLTRYEEGIKSLPGGLGDRTAGVYHILIQAGLFSESGISTRELEALLNNSYTTIKKELDFINGLGLLIRNKVGREFHYSIDLERLDSMLP